MKYIYRGAWILVSKLEKVKICTRCMIYVPIYPGIARSVEEVQLFENVHHNHPVVCLGVNELDTRVYKKFNRVLGLSQKK